jgi:hypothetical protein
MTLKEYLTQEPEITDKSLLKCTIKKSANVTKKLLVFGGKAGVLIAIAAGLIWGGLNIISRIINAVYPTLAAVSATIYNLLVSIPLWVYGISTIPAIILGYSFLWCVKRDLTEEDWKSREANDFAALATHLALAFAFAVLALVLAALALVLAALAFAFAVLAVLVFVIEPVPKITPMYYIFRFPGAWWHHRKTIAEKTEESEES